MSVIISVFRINYSTRSYYLVRLSAYCFRRRRSLFNLFLFVAVNFQLAFLVVCVYVTSNEIDRSQPSITFTAAIRKFANQTHIKCKRIGAYIGTFARFVPFWRDDLLFSFTCATSVLLLYNIPYPARWRWRRYWSVQW